MNWPDHFSRQAEIYAKYRPYYPKELYDFLRMLVKSKQQAWDCGTGNGQVAIQLATFFERVIATDASAAQLQYAKPLPNLEYRVSLAETSGLAAKSINLITVAQAIHWFDFEKFYQEVRRVAAEEAWLAVWGYGLLKISQPLDAILQHFYTHVVGPYWEPERKHLDQAYLSIPFPFAAIPTPTFTMQLVWTLEELVGYLNTWSSTQKFITLEKYNPVEELAMDLKKSWGTSAERKLISWELYLKVGRV